MNTTALFEVGETLKSLFYVSRVDGRSSISPGDLVKVTKAYTFNFNNEPCQDITVQRGREAPIAVLVKPGRFQRVPHG